MSEKLLPAAIVETGEKPDASVIWLHGLGADGHDFEPIVPELNLPESCSVRFIFPHAPSMPVTVNGGYIMPAWYDIWQDEDGFAQDEDGIRASAARVQQWIDHEIMHGIPASRIVLAGFSQGAAMSIFCGVRQPEALAGIMALSGYLVVPEKLAAEHRKTTLSSSVFVAHGVSDDVVPYAGGDLAQRRLAELGYQVAWHTYPMAHSVHPQEIAEIGRWLARVLAAS